MAPFHRFFSFLSLLLLFRSTLSVKEKCDAYCPEYSMEQSLKKFRDAVDGLYSGQEDAIGSITKALMKNMIANKDFQMPKSREHETNRMKPLLLHFTGPTGVGKTLMAQLLQESLFMTECGVKKIHLDGGYKYASASGQRERIDNMKRTIVSQLERCPRSLIIFDDFQWAPEMMILSLRDAFDESIESLTFRDKRVSTSRAIFVFCSDLESEQRHLSENMTIEQARKKVSELAGRQWKMVDQTTSFGKLFVSDGMIPFVPLSEPELRKVIHIEMGKLTPRVERYLNFNANNHTVDYKWLGRVRWNEKRLDPAVLTLLDADLKEYNARSIRNLIEKHLLIYATSVAKCLLNDSVKTDTKGWIWGKTVNLLDDIKIEKVDHAHSFTVTIGEVTCIGGGGENNPSATLSWQQNKHASSPTNMKKSGSGEF